MATNIEKAILDKIAKAEDLAKDAEDTIESSVKNFKASAEWVFGSHDPDGNSGNNTLTDYSVTGTAFIRGRDGKDVLRGKSSNEVELYGGNGQDKLYGMALVENKLYGGDADDIVFGLGGGSSRLFGGSGDDTLYAASLGSNKLYGGDGKDKIYALASTNNVEGGDGQDFIYLAGFTNTAYGGSGDDHIHLVGVYNDAHGGGGNDKIQALGGTNVIRGNAGHDQLFLAGGINDAFGGEGDDKIVAFGGLNLAEGGGGDDRIVALGKGNMLEGGAGADVLVSAGSVNVMLGNDGSDLIAGGGTANIQSGGSGHDALFGAGGGNLQLGGNGDDIIVGGGKGNVQFGDQIDLSLAFDLGFEIVNAIELASDKMSWLFGESIADDLGKKVDLEELLIVYDQMANETGSGDDLMIGGGTGNIQIASGGDDVVVGAGTGNVQDGGSGSDFMFGWGKGLAQYGGSGGDIMIGLGAAATQRGEDGDDTMIALARGKKTGVLSQNGGDGEDFFLGVSGRVGDTMPERLAKYYKKAEKFLKSGNNDGGGGDATPYEKAMEFTKSYAANKLPKGVTIQKGGAGDDVFVTDTDLSVQVGHSGDDTFVGGGDYTMSFGGNGADLMLTDAESVNVLSGGGGADFLIDMGVFSLFAAKRYAGVKMAEFADDMEARASDMAKVNNKVHEVESKLEELNPLKEVQEKIEDFKNKASSFVDLKTTHFNGGNGNDIIGAGNAGGDMVGGAGDDTYLYTFGSSGSHVIDEYGLDVAHDWETLAGVSVDALDDLQSGGSQVGGNDILEIRNWQGVAEFELANLRFDKRDSSDDLEISFQQKGGASLDFGSILIKNMDDTDKRVETLRLVTQDDSGKDIYTDYNLAEAWDNANFDMIPVEEHSGMTDAESRVNDMLIGFEDTLDLIVDGISDAASSVKSHAADINDLLDGINSSMIDDNGIRTINDSKNLDDVWDVLSAERDIHSAASDVLELLG